MNTIWSFFVLSGRLGEEVAPGGKRSSGRMSQNQILLQRTVREFFQEVVRAALHNQQVRTHELAAGYLADLLSGFTRAETLHEKDDKGIADRPLTFLLGDALSAS